MRKSEWAHYLVFLLVLLLFLPLLNSCKEDENSDIGTGKSATIKVSVGTSSATTSRSLDEDAISNLHVLVFNSSGQLVGWNYATSTTVNVQTIQGRGFTIYAVANTGDEKYFSGITTLEAFKLKTTTAISDADAPGSSSGILMCGSLSDQTIDSNTMSFKDFKLTRLLAKITLTVTPASGVTVTGYRFRNVPSSSYVTPGDADASKGWIDGSVVGGSTVSASSVEINGVSFYLYENRRGTRVTVDGSTGTTSKESEKATYAPSEATYVEIYARGEGFTSTYKVYLGSDKSNDYNIKRNNKYTCSVTINSDGSSDARVSVSHWGADITSGDVSVSTQSLAVGTANCYLLAPGATLTFPVNIKGNGNADLLVSGSITHRTSSVGILWETSSDLISSLSLSGGYATVTASSSSGNAVIAAYDTDGTTILWSWHIWVTDYDPDDGGTTYTNSTTNTTFMDRNLGATAVGTSMTSPLSSYGLYYQWGRKDPFPSANATSLTTGFSGVTGSAWMYGTKTSVTITSGPVSIATATENPTTFYSNSSSPYDWNSFLNDSLWGNSTTSTVEAKSPYDPCPVGWRVPVWKSGVSPWNGFSTYSALASSLGYYPASGYRHCSNGAFYYVGSYGYSWAASPYGSYCCYLYYLSSNVYPSTGDAGRATGFGVRCCRE